MTTTDADLDHIMALASAATPGPWDGERDCGNHLYAPDPDNPGQDVCIGAFGCRDDAAFAAMAREKLPQIVDELRRLRALHDKASEA